VTKREVRDGRERWEHLMKRMGVRDGAFKDVSRRVV
jgi:hypothetical protein